MTSPNGRQPAGEPELQREGDAYVWLWPSLGYRICFDMLRESPREGLVGEVTVEMAQRIEGRRGLVHWARMCLSSTRAREEVSEVCQRAVARLPWGRMLEVVCTRTAEEWRRGEEVIDLSKVTVDARVRYLVERFLPEGKITGLCADGGVGKGYVALLISLTVRAGVALPGGLRATKSVPVLYLDWEEDAAENRRRLDWLARGMGLSGAPEIYYRRMERPLADDIGVIKARCQDLAIGLVIVDSIAPATGTNPNDAENAIRISRAMRELSPATVLYLAHVTHETARSRGQDRARVFGSVYFQNLARNIWELRGEAGDDELALGFFHGKTNVKKESPFGWRLVFDNERCAARVVPQSLEDSPELAARLSVGSRLRAALKRGRRTTTELETELGISGNTICATLGRMRDVGGDGLRGRGRVASWWLLAHEQ